ncbi:MAG TPA: alpha/beta fold hydrolase [Blastocatellia bacterium]|nr:alpha/beta fold hydrolase [Blastocatellia bacterium]
MSTGDLAVNQSWSGVIGDSRAKRPGRFRWLIGLIAGHFWTIAPAMKAALMPAPAPAPEARPLKVTVDDPRLGSVRLNGLLSEAPASDTLVLIVHGMAGDANSHYCVTAARVVAEAGFSALRLSMRGADLSGEDIYHGGLTGDLTAVLASPELARYGRVFLLGYSFGGHLTLRAAVDRIDPRLRAVAAICPPLDLKATMRSCDSLSRRFYRWNINRAMNKSYARTAARRNLPTPVEALKRARTCDEWHSLAIAPRFGFRDADDYYRRVSVAADLHRLRVPALVIACENDPIVEPETLHAALADASRALIVRWVARGGHVYFPADLDLGQGGPLGLEAQVMRWLSRL